MRTYVTTPLLAGALALGLATTAFAATGQFKDMCAWGLANHKEVHTNCEPCTRCMSGKTYCFSSQQAKTDFMKNPKANLAKAEKNYKTMEEQVVIWTSGIVTASRTLMTVQGPAHQAGPSHLWRVQLCAKNSRNEGQHFTPQGGSSCNAEGRLSPWSGPDRRNRLTCASGECPVGSRDAAPHKPAGRAAAGLRVRGQAGDGQRTGFLEFAGSLRGRGARGVAQEGASDLSGSDMGDGVSVGHQLRRARPLLEVLRASHSLPAEGGGRRRRRCRQERAGQRRRKRRRASRGIEAAGEERCVRGLHARGTPPK